MIVAMFLSKDLMLDWHLGEQARLFIPFFSNHAQSANLVKSTSWSNSSTAT